MNIKKQIIKLNKISPFSLLAVGFIAGLVIMYLFFQPKLILQEKTARDFANVANKNQTIANQNKKEADTYKGKLASASAEIKTLLNAPPKIEYRTVTQTQYVKQPAPPQSTSSNCSPDYAGGMYCTSNTGVQTHCTSNYVGGYNCN